MTRNRWTLICSLLGSFVVGCGPTPDNGTGDDVGPGEGSGSGDGGTGPQCQPSGDFVSEAPVDLAFSHASPGYKPELTYSAALNVANGVPRLVVGVRFPEDPPYANYDGAVVLVRAPAGWDHSGFGVGDAALSYPGDLAATPDGTLCAAYRYKDSSLHLMCDGIDDRVLAPKVDSSLAMIETGTTEQLVYVTDSGLVLQSFDTTPGPDQVGVADVIDPLLSPVWASIGTTSIAIDGAGDFHVAYSEVDYDSTARHVYHAFHHAGLWTRELVDTDVETSYYGQSIDSESSTVSLVIDGDQPVIAYAHQSTKSLRLARRTSGGTFDVRTLVAPDPGFPDDSAGQAVALQRDCSGELLVIYQRSISTDSQTNNANIAYARITDAGLEDKMLLPVFAIDSGPSAPAQDLGFYIDSSGNQYATAKVGGRAYFASR